MTSFDNEQLIDRYLSGEMTKEERDNFESSLKNNPGLAGEVQIHRKAHEALNQYVPGLKARLREEGIQILAKRRKMLLISAGALLLAACLAGWFLVQKMQTATPPPPPQNKEPIALFEENYERVNVSAQLGDAAEGKWEEARKYYQQGNCEMAIPLLQTFGADSAFSARPTALLLLGSCYLETGRPAAALAFFEAIPGTSGNVYRKGLWYSALAHLKNNDPLLALPFLEEVAADAQNEYQERAVAILNSLPVGREKSKVDSLKKK